MYLFNTKIENPEKLEQMLVGREHIVNTLVDAQLKHAKDGMPPQFLVVGPRGSGKTHMLRIIYERLSRNTDYMAMHEIAYMVEDETGIGSYFDLLQRVFEALKRWSNDDQKTRFIIDQVENLKEIHPKDWTKSAENILLNILKDKSLLILIENFDAIMRGMDKKDRVLELARLRDFIQQHNQLSFIATSQSLIHSLSDDQNPLYGFFNVIQLKRLTLDESFEYIKKITLSENNDELLQFLETHDGKGHLEAIHQFTKGNHRLLLVFFDFLKAEFRSNLSDVFLKSIDELKPYYDSFLKSLAPQQQKIVQYLSLQRNPQKGADIGRNCFLDKSTVSKQLSELQRLGYINPVNEKGRDKYYEITEPLLRMCIEINEDRHGIIKLFVNFLGQLYTADQLKEKYLHYNYIERFQPEPVRKLYQAEARFYGLVRSQYLSNWVLKEEEEKMLYNCCEPDEARKMVIKFSHQNESNIDELDQIRELIQNEEWVKAIASIEKKIETNPMNAELYFWLGNSLREIKQIKKSIVAFLKSIELNPNNYSVWNNLGFSYSENQQYKKSIEAYLKATEIRPNDEVLWNNLGISYRNAKETDKSIEAFLKATEIKSDNEVSWNILGDIYNEIEKNEESIEAYQKAIDIKPDDAFIWFKLGFAYLKMVQYDKAIKHCLKVVEIEPTYEGFWNILGLLYGITKQYDKSIEAYLKEIELKSDNSDTWNNLGKNYYEKEQLSDAKNAYLQAINHANEVDSEEIFGYYSNLLEVLFTLKETNEALSAMDTLFSKPKRFAYITKLGSAIMLLVKDNSESEIKEILSELLKICEANNKLAQLSALLSNVVFALLRLHNEIKPFRLDMLKNLFEELFAGKSEFTYPLRYFDIGFRYFVTGEKEAIYEMSQEERMIFEKFTSY